METPKLIWANEYGWTGDPKSATEVEAEYLRADVAQAMVAAACEGCAEYAESVGAFADEIGDNLRDLTPDSARAALDALLKAEREKALREAAKIAGSIAVDTLKDEEPNVSLVRLQFRRRAFESKILALIDKDKADA